MALPPMRMPSKPPGRDPRDPWYPHVPACGTWPYRFPVYRIEWRWFWFKRILVTHAWAIQA